MSAVFFFETVNPIPPGLFEGGSAFPGGRGGGRKVPAAHNSKTINENGMKFGRVVENHKVINLVRFNWLMTSL